MELIEDPDEIYEVVDTVVDFSLGWDSKENEWHMNFRVKDYYTEDYYFKIWADFYPSMFFDAKKFNRFLHEIYEQVDEQLQEIDDEDEDDE
ncbi:hypothetical protein ACE198_22395 [Neobacillus sp. KR4-4]|uniref:hypothetical protein n=1 Tax=Neobacillus sp. KR4-4 TaxID=3344872 RepID=UPI0035CA85AC